MTDKIQNPIQDVRELIRQLESEPNYLSVKIPVELIDYLDSDWSFWVFTRELAKNNIVPSSKFRKTEDIGECIDLLKESEGEDKFLYCLQFIGLRNRLVKHKILGLLDVH